MTLTYLQKKSLHQPNEKKEMKVLMIFIELWWLNGISWIKQLGKRIIESKNQIEINIKTMYMYLREIGKKLLSFQLRVCKAVGKRQGVEAQVIWRELCWCGLCFFFFFVALIFLLNWLVFFIHLFSLFVLLVKCQFGHQKGERCISILIDKLTQI